MSESTVTEREVRMSPRDGCRALLDKAAEYPFEKIMIIGVLPGGKTLEADSHMDLMTMAYFLKFLDLEFGRRHGKINSTGIDSKDQLKEFMPNHEPKENP